MRGAGTFLLGTSLVMYVANGIHINADKGNLWPAVIIGTMSCGAGMALLIAHRMVKK